MCEKTHARTMSLLLTDGINFLKKKFIGPNLNCKQTTNTLFDTELWKQNWSPEFVIAVYYKGTIP